jgi:hypothetical protein
VIDTYKGESDQKRWARLLFWLHLHESTATERKLVLASRNGGDIATLAAGGVDLSTVVAVDRCSEALAACEANHPGPQYVVGDAADVAEREQPFCAALLDFCGPICADTLATTMRVARCVRFGGLLGVAVLRGRESSSRGTADTNRACSINRHWRRMLGSSGATRRVRRDPALRMAFELERFKAGLSSNRDALNSARAYYAPGVARSRMLQQAMLCSGILTTLVLTIDYQSSTGESSGVPMTIAVFIRGGDGLLEEESIVGVSSKCKAMGSDRVLNVGALRPNVRAASLQSDWLAMALNVDPRKLAAWKAVRTMGTETSGRVFGISPATVKRMPANELHGLQWAVGLLSNGQGRGIVRKPAELRVRDYPRGLEV